MSVIKRVVLLCALALSPLLSQAAQYTEGVHYQRLAQPQPTSTGDKIEVVEVFWYGCPHCFRIEPYVERWLRKKPENAEFVRIPGILRPSWENHGRAFYTAKLLGVFDKVHRPLFNAIHLEKRPLNTDEALMDFFAQFGVDKERFIKTFRSFAVETRIRRAKTMAMRYGINGVPAFVVNGKYLVTNRMTGGNAQTMKVISYLVKKESGS